jgi:aminopeptidase N
VDRRQPIVLASPVDLTRWKEYFLAHEIAHQWWGQCVTWKTYRDQWLSEGLAQFSTAQFLKRTYGQNAYTDIMERFCQWTNKMSVWGQISLGSRLSILKFEAYQAIIYNKTSVILNLLLEVIGEEAFWSGMRDFYLTHRFSAARTADFRKSMEQASGRELGLFFKSWFDSHALPEARVELSEVTSGQERFLQVNVSQKSEVFVFPLWLEWSEDGAKGEHKIIVDAKAVSRRLPFRGRLGGVKLTHLRLVPGRVTVAR